MYAPPLWRFLAAQRAHLMRPQCMARCPLQYNCHTWHRARTFQHNGSPLHRIMGPSDVSHGLPKQRMVAKSTRPVGCSIDVHASSAQQSKDHMHSLSIKSQGHRSCASWVIRWLGTDRAIQSQPYFSQSQSSALTCDASAGALFSCRAYLRAAVLNNPASPCSLPGMPNHMSFK